MAAILVILLCSVLFGHETFGYKQIENGGNQNTLLEKKENEKYGKSIKVLKRSVGEVNEIGGSNINADVETTTTVTNIINYSAPGSDVTHDVNVKSITPNYDGGDNQNFESSHNAQNSSESSMQSNNNGNWNNAISGSNTDKQDSDIDYNKASGNKTVNNNNNSTAISQSAIASSNQSSAISHEYALSSSQNDYKNDTTDTFATPVTSTRGNVSGEITSTDKMANFIGGSNLNTTPRSQVDNKMNNDIPELTTQNPNVNSIIQTTSVSDNLISTNPQTTVPTKTEMTTEVSSLVTTTLQTQIESHADHSSLPPTSSSTGDDEIPASAESSDEPFTESNKTTAQASSTTQPYPENTPEPTPTAEIIKTNTTKNEPVSEPFNNVTESIPETEVSAEPELKNGTSAATPEPESQTEATPDPVPEPEDNSTVGDPESSPATENTNNTGSGIPESTAKTVTSIFDQTTVPINKINTTESDINETNGNETAVESSPKPTVEPNHNVTNAITPNPESSVEPEDTELPTKNSTTSEPTTQPEKTSTWSISTQRTTIMPNSSTSKVEPEGQVTPEPESEVTPEPEAENTTHSEPVGGNTTKLSASSTRKPTLMTTSEKKIPSPEPTNNPETTVYPEPSPETSDKSVTTANPSSNLTTTVKVTVEPTAEPEKYSSTEQTHIDNTTTAIPDTEVEPEPEDENPKSEPEDEEGDSSGKQEFDTDAFAEPGPDWKLAKPIWKEAWEFHVYFYGIAFSVLGLYCLVTLIRLWGMEHLLSKHYFITLHLLVIFVCILRATYLMVDAYNSLGTFPSGLDYFIYSTAFPCLTALFSILFYALLLATRVRVISPKVQNLWVLVFIVSLHFLLSISTDIVVGLFSSASIMIFICQVFFIVWGLLMFVGYLVLFRKLYKGAINRQKTMMGSPHEHKNTATHGYHVKPSKQKYTLGLAVKITFISAFFGVAIVGFELYGMFGVYGVLKLDTKPDPWPWWTYHTILRSLEILMCLSVAYVASQPLRYKMKKNLDNRIHHYLLPCCICCCPDSLDQNEIYSSSISLDYVASETDHLSWLKKMKNKTSTPKAPYPPHTAEKYSDPDATLLVRKIKRTSKPSMLVVEDGFVRIRREDETLPSNQYELDSRSSHSSDMNTGPDDLTTGAVANVVNLNYTGHNRQNAARENVPGVNFDNYLLQGNVSNNGYTNDNESADETDIDIVVTESEHESDSRDSSGGGGSGTSNKSADIFRPLSMIDLAASMESELERAFHSSGVGETDVISHNSLPVSFDGYNTDSNGCAFNESLCEKYCDNKTAGAATNLDSTNYSSDSADDQSKSSAHVRLIRPLVRRCKSDDSKSSSPKYKHFEKNKYFSVSSVDNLGKDEEVNTHVGSNGEMRTEL
ncbi:uncharacterized protein LOC123529603 [Mercenaria mercenaria]|uniref:uncharacterized protein LOC123529603 n=1 Tax=Mercenaria mercenaria TaxID=6596 RepID=UPI00234E9404|nr:uncharacterized protein LOC123529603 [Mercenaria mercenaria]XP_045165930.2 uncharacterized protein LOC123529603 [Mercenaria mercenaria]XP_053377844.1 uncharacterized protein LOC123529603 [Mercenaria mercenaria]